MALVIDLQSPRTDISCIKRAILETLAYSDIFDYPLKLEELYRFLTVPASLAELTTCLAQNKNAESKDGFYFLRGRADIPSLRLHRERSSRSAYEHAIRYGRILGILPFIRMVALTGSLALRNCDETGDYDYMLVAKPGRVWLARAFALVLNRIAHVFGETLCPNLIVSEDALEWTSRDLYSAREICQMIPISGEDVYIRLRVANSWVREFLPNTSDRVTLSRSAEPFEAAPKDLRGALQEFLEFPLRGRLGDLFESWEMNRKIARFKQQEGFGIETQFNADICQGNFGHHGSWTMQNYRERLHQLGIVPLLPILREGSGVRVP